MQGNLNFLGKLIEGSSLSLCQTRRVGLRKCATALRPPASQLPLCFMINYVIKLANHLKNLFDKVFWYAMWSSLRVNTFYILRVTWILITVSTAGGSLMTPFRPQRVVNLSKMRPIKPSVTLLFLFLMIRLNLRVWSKFIIEVLVTLL